jgi:hypothetical protein
VVDLVRVSVGDETMANLRAVTRELQALEPSVASLSERAYGVVRLLSDEADRAWSPDSVHVGVWEVLHSDPDIAAFYGVVGNLARHIVAVIDGYPAGDPD